ncbi:hypothetical protein U7230_07745 [Carboxydochorda subterranea]|uniref:Uncharacterized protein n=1 Tax=Carboxydichorda subterranea TaxID=3109565 RepID=A0ABZ1C1X2_9FIRM|nr:hypothetical protein [Limnochorda sp. L945t]WRP18873.1 hypothetical protein U7230_07745 [Limnochorda sp. L945t]
MVMMHYSPEPDWPCVGPDGAPVDVELYARFAPKKLELVRGYLINGPEHPEARLRPLALLLRNVGLKAALRLAPREAWKRAMREAEPFQRPSGPARKVTIPADVGERQRHAGFGGTRPRER